MQKITQAVILAGGQGKRLKPFTLNNPKSLIPINGKPFMDYLIELLKSNGIKEVVILTGYLEEKIREHVGDGSKYGTKVRYSYTPLLNEKGEENQSGIRIKNAEKLLDDFFMLLYCDNYWPLNLQKLTSYFKNHPSDVLITVYSNIDNSTKNNIFVEDGFVTKYDQNRKDKNLNGVDIGFFAVNKKVLKLLPKGNSKFESVVLPALIKKRRLSGYLSSQKYYSIGDMTRVKLTQKFLSPKKVVFLDRDGVINKKPPKAHYIKTWNDFIFLPKVLDAIKRLNSNGFKAFIVSNQAGIARGVMTERDLNLIHRNLKKELKKFGAKIDGIYYCPHGWDEDCICRKPKPGMLLQASREHFIDLRKAIFIGDDERDKKAGDAVDCKTILVKEKDNLLKVADKIVHNIQREI